MPTKRSKRDIFIGLDVETSRESLESDKVDAYIIHLYVWFWAEGVGNKSLPFVLNNNPEAFVFREKENSYSYLINDGTIGKQLVDFLMKICNEEHSYNGKEYCGYNPILVSYNATYDILTLLKPYLLKTLNSMGMEVEIKDLCTENCKEIIKFELKCKGKTKRSPKLKIKWLDPWFWDKHQSLKNYSERLRMYPKGTIDYEKCSVTYDEKKKVFNYVDFKNKPKSVSLEDEITYGINDVKILPHILTCIYRDMNLLYKQLGIPCERRLFWPNILTKGSFSIYTAGHHISKVLEEQKRMNKALYGKCLFGKNCASERTYLSDYKKVFRDRYRPIISKEEYEIQSASSRGGLTGFSEIYPRVKGHIATYDVNSMYPYIIHNGIPCGRMHLNLEGLKGKKVITMVAVRVFSINSSIYGIVTPILAKEKWCKKEMRGDLGLNGAVFFSVEEWGELLLALEDPQSGFKMDFEFLQKVYYEKCTLLTSFIDKLNFLKEQSDRDENPFLRKGVKLIMNNLYGKCCEKTRDVEFHLDYLIKQDDEKIEWGKTPVPKAKLNYRSQMGGCYIISGARAILLKAIRVQDENANHVLYADTDSVKILVNNKEGLDALDIHPTRLGAWKAEGEFEEYLCPKKKKKYMLINHTKKFFKVTLSGIKTTLWEEAGKDYKNLPIFEKLMNHRNNVMWLKGRLAKKINKDGQPVLMTVNVEINKELGYITHIVEKDVEGKPKIRCIM